MKHTPYSHSKIQCALRCPIDFYYRYLMRDSNRLSGPQSYVGTAVHEFLEKYGNRLNEKKVSTDYSYGEKLIEEMTSKYIFQDNREKIQKICEYYLYSFILDTDLPVFNEMNLAINDKWNTILDFNDPTAYFRGKIDRLSFEYGDSEIIPCVTDYKTGFLTEGNDEQIRAYAKMAYIYCQNNWEKISKDYPLSKTVKLNILNLNLSKKSSEVLEDIDEVSKIVNHTDQMICDIESMDLKRGNITGRCEYCNHIQYCEVFNHNDEGTKITKDWLQLKSDVSLHTNAIKNYVKEHGDIEYEKKKLGFTRKKYYTYYANSILPMVLKKAIENYKKDYGGDISGENLEKLKSQILSEVPITETITTKILKKNKIDYELDELRDKYGEEKERNEFDFVDKEEEVKMDYNCNSNDELDIRMDKVNGK